MSPTIYHYQDAFAVSQKRYDSLIARGKGWSATPTLPTADDTLHTSDVAKTDQRFAGKYPYPRPKVLTQVTSMASGHGWTASGALTNAMNDGTDFALGSQSAYITSKTDTTRLPRQASAQQSTSLQASNCDFSSR